MIIKVREFNNDYTDDADVPYDLLDKAAAEATAVAGKDKDALEAELRKVLGDRLDRVDFAIGDVEYDDDKGRDHYHFTATVPVTLNVYHKTDRDEYDDVLDKIDSCFGDIDLSIEYEPDDSKGYANDTDDALDAYKGYYTYTFETEADT